MTKNQSLRTYCRGLQIAALNYGLQRDYKPPYETRGRVLKQTQVLKKKRLHKDSGKKQEEMTANSPCLLLFHIDFFPSFSCTPCLFTIVFSLQILLLLLNNTDALYKGLSCYYTQAPSPLTLQMSFQISFLSCYHF